MTNRLFDEDTEIDQLKAEIARLKSLVNTDERQPKTWAQYSQERRDTMASGKPDPWGSGSNRDDRVKLERQMIEDATRLQDKFMDGDYLKHGQHYEVTR